MRIRLSDPTRLDLRSFFGSVHAVDDLASAVRVLARVRSGSHSGLEEVVEQRAERIAIDADKAVEFNVDGELVGLTTPAVFERVGRLRLRAPSG